MKRQGKTASRVLLLELDSLSLPFIKEHLDYLPNLRQLVESGSVVETDSSAGIASASVWPTFASGTWPGHHGHYFPFQWHAEKMRFYRPYRKAWNGALQYEPFWYRLAREGFECLVLDAVQCIPDAQSPCLEINDWSAQSSSRALTTDPELLKELRKRFGRNPIGAEVTVSKSRRQSARLLEQAIASLKQKTDALIWLGNSRSWQFYLASIQDVHRAGHNLWPIEGEFASDVPPGALLDVYKAMDASMARIVEAFSGDDTFILFFTLNGMAPNRAQNHFLPQLLRRLNHLYTHGERLLDVSSRRKGLMAVLRDKVPAPAQYWANHLLGEDVQDWVVNREYLGALDWRSTPSFAIPSGGEGFVRFNIRGRERRGMLSADSGEVEAYSAWLRERLLEVRASGTGEPLISEVIDLHDIYPGEKSGLLPDLALQWAPDRPCEEIVSPDVGTIRKRLTTGRGGNHTGASFALLTDKVRLSGAAESLDSITCYAGLVERLLLGRSNAA